MPKSLARAIRIASEAHENQIDKSSEPYVLHVLRVMMNVGNNKSLMAAAVMHDVLEDSSITSKDLERFHFSEEIIQAVESVTHDKNRQSYEDFIEQVKKNRWGCIIKMKDIEDNTSSQRLQQLDMETMKRLLGKYEKAKYQLWESYVEACYKVYGHIL